MDKNRVFTAAARFGAARERLSRLLAVRAGLRATRAFLLCALLAQGNIYGGFAPLGTAMAGAFCAVGAGVPAALGSFFGYLFLRPGDGQAISYAAASLLTLCTAHVFADTRLVRRPWFLPGVTALSLGACGFVFLPALNGRWLSLFAGVLLLTAVACRCYLLALSPPSDGVVARPAAFLIVTASVLLAASDLTVAGRFAPARAAAALLVMAAARLCGSAVGAAVGVGLGLAMDAPLGDGAYFTCVFAFAALAAGAFRDCGRRAFALFFAAAAGCAALLGLERAVFFPSVYELAIAAVSFAALPTPLWEGIRETLLPERVQTANAAARFRQASLHRAEQTAGAFYELYLSMLGGARHGRATADEQSRAVFNAAAERVCRSCDICAYCWQRDYISTLSALDDVTVPMLRRGRAQAGDFPRHFSSRCIHFPELLRTINEALFALREREEYRRRQEEERSLIARQYAGITGVLRQLSSGLSRDYPSLPARERQVLRYAAAFGPVEQTAVFRDGSGRLRVEVAGAGLDAIEAQGAGFAAGLSALLGVSLTAPERVSDELGERLCLREQATFRAVIGTGQQPKEEVSGDSALHFLTEDGTACLLLCDGMGTGEQAAQDSREFLRLMERFLSAGVPLEESLRAVEPSYRIRSGGRRFVTLDALTVDLFSGRACSLKCGAAPSYHVTAGGLTRLNGAALPVGLAAEGDAPAETVPLRLAHGDLFVLLSDGVCDGTDDGWVRALLADRTVSPRELAARLISEARQRGSADDMTALVLRLEKRRK